MKDHEQWTNRARGQTGAEEIEDRNAEIKTVYDHVTGGKDKP